MKNTIVIYLDLSPIPSDIKSVVDIEYLGDLIHRKKKLWESHKSMYEELELNNFILVRTSSKLEQVIEQIQTSTLDSIIIQSARFAITNREKFQNFIKRIVFVDKDLAVFDFDEVKSFAKLNCTSAIDVLTAILRNSSEESKIIKECFSKLESFKLEDFYIEITNYVQFISFLQSNFELRYFNAIEKDENIITKKSTDKEKLKREFDYHQFLPDELAIFFIKPFAFEVHENTSQYKMQRLNIPDLSLQWIHYSITERDFKVLLAKLFQFIKARPYLEVSKDAKIKNAKDLYLNKLTDRILNLKTLEVFAGIESLIKTSTPYTGIDEILSLYLKVYDKVILANNYPGRLVLGHGDFCLSNMLYDKRIDLLKLIDPKGGSVRVEVYMEEHYDIAKLSHSILGNYDFINNGLFELEFSTELQLTLKIDNLALLKKNQLAFKEGLRAHGYDYRLIRLLEASLFLSMLPLHMDNKKKILAFILTAIQILKEIENVD